MTYKTCYWDATTKSQKERDVTPEEQIEIEARIASRGDVLAALVRQERNKKLSASDWTQVLDAPVDRAAWSTYRQSLRDISTQEGFPTTVSWPLEPQN